MSFQQAEIQEGFVEGNLLRLACLECGRVYHEMLFMPFQNVCMSDFHNPIVPCHVGMVKVTAPSLDPLTTVQRVLGVLPEPPKFRAILMLMDGMIVGYSLEGAS